MTLKIRLFCASGMSTSLLVKKMKDQAEKINADVDIEAFSTTTIKKYGADADVLLLGPQIRYMEPEIKEEFPDKKVATINIRDYGMMDGKKVLNDALEFAK
jgi:PTS system cellobiose-specific IIB component